MDLTDRGIRGLKPLAREYAQADSGPGGRRGLYLVVLPSGRKLFRARVTVDGETQYKNLEPDYPQLTLAGARDAFDDYRRERRRRSTAYSAEVRRMTVADLFDEWERVYLTKHRKDPEAVRRAIEKDVIPRIGKVLVSAVERRDLVLVVDRVLERGSVRMADQLRSFVLQMFAFAVQRGFIDASPALLLPKPKRGRHAETRERVLDDEEIRRFWWAFAPEGRDAVPAEHRDRYLARVAPYTKRALRLLLLLGLRRSEVVDGRWAEFDLETEGEEVWTLPAERTKAGREHVVPLPDFAVEILREQRELTGGYEFVFASPKADFTKPMLASAVSQAINDNYVAVIDKRRPRETDDAYRARVEAAKFTPHDLRRTLRSRLASLGVNHIVSRKVLGHTLDGMDKIYDRHAYLDEQRDALQKWADELRAILAGAERKVVPIREGARR